MLTLLAACGYNWLQTQRLEAQVGRLQRQVDDRQSVQRLSVQKPRPGGGDDWLGRAAAEAALARAALDRSERQVPATERRLRAMQIHMKSMQDQADALWRARRPAPRRRSP